jgi:hypothetical protein
LTTALARTTGEFGVVIATTGDHLHWAKGACASVRYFMGDTPICLFLDGRGTVGDLQRTYGADVLRIAELEHRGLRELSGSTKVKQAVLWTAPYETFLFLDADTIVWGDLRRLANLDRFDFVVDAPLGPERSRKSVMDPEAVGRHFPSFDARGHMGDFVNSGVFFARRGALELNRYLELLRFSRRHPDVFLFGHQGLFNLMIFSQADEGTLRVDQQELQVRVGHTRREELAQRFAFADGKPRVRETPVAIHWVGIAKPTIRARERDFFEPMTFFRRQFRLALRGDTRPSAMDDVWLRFEDMRCGDWRGSNLRGRFRAKRRRVGKQIDYRIAQLKVAVRLRATRWLSSLSRR